MNICLQAMHDCKKMFATNTLLKFTVGEGGKFRVIKQQRKSPCTEREESRTRGDQTAERKAGEQSVQLSEPPNRKIL